MTEEVLDAGIASASQGLSQEGSHSVTSQPVQQTPSERLVPQSEVNKLVGGVKHEAFERGRKEALAELQKQRSLSTDTYSQGSPQPSGISSDEIQRLIDQRFQAQQQQLEQQQQQIAAQQFVQQFDAKLANGKSKYQDFDAVVVPLIKDLANNNSMGVFQLAHMVDNTDDVMYELGNNPGKVAELSVLAITAPTIAKTYVENLSKSIKQNQQAKLVKQPNAPLGQIRPSITGTDSGNEASMQVKDFRMMFKR